MYFHPNHPLIPGFIKVKVHFFQTYFIALMPFLLNLNFLKTIVYYL